MSENKSDWPALPTETEIYILPSGEIVVADLPAELSAWLAQLTQTTQCAPAALDPEAAEGSPPCAALE